MKYTVNVYGTVEKQYTIEAESAEEAEDLAMDRFEETHSGYAVSDHGWDNIEADAWFVEKS